VTDTKDKIAKIAQLTASLKDGQQLAPSDRMEKSESLWALAQDVLEKIPCDSTLADGVRRLTRWANEPIRTKAKALLENLAAQGNATANYRLGQQFRNSNSFEKAKEHLLKAKKLGHDLADFELGFMYLRYSEIDTDEQRRYQLALQYLEIAAKTYDEPEAWAYLSLMSKEGLGVEVNLERHQVYFNHAWRIRHDGRSSPRANASYGLECLMAKRFDEALEHLLIGTRDDKGRGDAMLNAAKLLLNEQVSEECLARLEKVNPGIVNPEKFAFELLDQAAKRSDDRTRFKFQRVAQFELAKLLRNGRGCKRNKDRSLLLMEAAAKRSYAPALKYLVAHHQREGQPETAEQYQSQLDATTSVNVQKFDDWLAIDFDTRRDVHIEFFNEMNELLQTEDYVAVTSRIADLHQWAVKQKTNKFAKQALTDAGILCQLGCAQRGLGQIEEAIASFNDSARGKTDAKHQSMCYSAMAQCAEEAGQCDKAADYYRDGYIVSQYPDMWVRHARSLFDHHPDLRKVALKKILAFMQRDVNWQEQDLVKIQFPTDKEPQKTCVAYAELLWRLSAESDRHVLPTQDSVKNTCNQLLFYLRKAAQENQHIDSSVLYAIARGAAWPEVIPTVKTLIENVGLGSYADAQVADAFPFPLLAGHKAEVLLNVIMGGLGRAHAYSSDLGLSVVKRISKSPEIIRTNPALGRMLAHLLWRCVVQAYYRSSRTPTEFRDCAYRLVLPLIATLSNYQDKELLRDWMFELVAADKATVEYSLVSDFLEEVCACHVNKYTGAFTRVKQTLLESGHSDLTAIANRLLAADSLLSHKAYGDLALDTADYCSSMLNQYIKYLFILILKPLHIKYFVDISGHVHADALTSAAARIDTTLLLSKLTCDAGPIKDLLTSAKQVNVAGIWVTPTRLQLSFCCYGAQPVTLDTHNHRQRVLQDVCNLHGRVVLNNEVVPLSERNPPTLLVTLDLTHASDGSHLLSEDWREYLIQLVQAHQEHREKKLQITDFFWQARDSMPYVDRPVRLTPKDTANAWAHVLHAVCDRYHAFFAGSLLREKDPARSPIGALHAIKTALSHLYDDANRGMLQEAQLRNFRELVRNIKPTAEQLLRKTLAGWSPSQFDLRAMLESPSGVLEQVFGHRADAYKVLGEQEFLVNAPKEQVRAAYKELLYNALHANAQSAISSPVVIEFQKQKNAVVIRNNRAVGDRRDSLSTGKGMRAAIGWLQASGFSLSSTEDANRFVVTINEQAKAMPTAYV
jgi:TPR repeat protein